MTEGPQPSGNHIICQNLTYKSPRPNCGKEIAVGDWELVSAWFRNCNIILDKISKQATETSDF